MEVPNQNYKKIKDSGTRKNNATQSTATGNEVGTTVNPDLTALDLSSTSRTHYKASYYTNSNSSLERKCETQNNRETGPILNLTKTDKLLPPPTLNSTDATMDLSTHKGRGKEPSLHIKSSSYSAEALLSKPQKLSEPGKCLPPLSMGIKGILVSDQSQRSPQPSPVSQRASPITPRTSPALTHSSPAPLQFSNTHSPSLESRSKTPSSAPNSPWHLPPHSSHSSPYSKPPVPVTPNIRQPSSSDNSQASGGFTNRGPISSVALPPTSTLPSGFSTETTFSSLSSLPSTSLQPPNNPYLSALMQQSPTTSLHQAPKQPSLPNMPPGYPSLGNPLDPASQYYAVLYQQQISAYQQAAAAAALSNPYGSQQAAAAAAAAGYRSTPLGMSAPAAAEMQALHAYKDMMTRAALGGNPSVSSQSLSNQASGSLSATSANSGANPYAALYAGLMGYPQTGFLGSSRKEGP